MRRQLGVVFAVLFLLGAGFQVHAQQAVSTYYDLGIFDYEDQEYQDAEENFKKALAADPESPVYHHYLGKTYLKMERYDDAKWHLETAWDKNPDLSGLEYDLAFLYYKLEDYKKASKHFTEVSGEDPSNVLSHYFGGMSLYKEKRYRKAANLFEDAAGKSPSLKVNSSYYAGICHYRLGNVDEASEHFTFVKQEAEKEELRVNADKWLATIKKKKAKKPYQLDLTLQYVYDDNVPLEPTGQDSLYSDESDSGIYGYAGGRYNIVNRNDFILGAGIARGQVWYSDLTQFNTSDTSADIYTSYKMQSFRFGLAYIPRLYRIDDEDYLLQHQIRPAISWQPSRDLLTRFVYAYYIKDYQVENNRDGNLHDGYLDVYYNILNGRGYVFGGLGYEVSSSEASEYGYNRSKIKAGVFMDLVWKVRLGLEGYYYRKSYPDSSSLYGVEREDDKFFGGVSLKRPIYWDWLSVSLAYDHITNSSNVDLFEYRRNTIGVGLEVNF